MGRREEKQMGCIKVYKYSGESSVVVSYEQIEEELAKVLRRFWIKREYVDPQGRRQTAEPRVVSLDMETSPLEEADHLTNERILTIAIAKRVSGELMSKEGVEVESLVLEEDSDRGEYKLLKEFNELLKPEPLGVVGYGIRGYDLPLLSIKMERYDPAFGGRLGIPSVEKLWHIINTLERAVHLDLAIGLRFKLKVSEFDMVLNHPKLVQLPLRKVKHPPRPKHMTPGMHSYNLWKAQPKLLKELAEAHAYNVLLIAEWYLFSW